MDQDRWNAVDAYIVDRLVASDEALDQVFAANAAAGLPAIDVSPPQGKLLHLIARMIGARRVLEIGTLGGYSTIWFARALPEGGQVVTLEAEPAHAEVARANFARAGVTDRIELRLGQALDSLAALAAEGAAPFDLVFIDADKPNNPHYLAFAMKLARPGAVIIADNVVREGEIVDASSRDPSIQGTRRMFDMMAEEPRLSATAIQTVGGKGWDGLSFAIVD
jgi:predicted O-methyltransferase YrrM